MGEDPAETLDEVAQIIAAMANGSAPMEMTAMAASKSGDEAEVFAESKQMMVDEVYAYPVLTGQATKQAFVEEAQTNFYQSCVTSFSQKLAQVGA